GPGPQARASTGFVNRDSPYFLAARDADHALQVAHDRERALELAEVGDVEGEAHECELVAGLRAHRRDVDLLARERIADVAQQPPAIGRRNAHIHRIGTAGIAPLGVDQPLGLRLGEALQARAVLAVHRDALAARDEAPD